MTNRFRYQYGRLGYSSREEREVEEKDVSPYSSREEREAAQEYIRKRFADTKQQENGSKETPFMRLHRQSAELLPWAFGQVKENFGEEGVVVSSAACAEAPYLIAEKDTSVKYIRKRFQEKGGESTT